MFKYTKAAINKTIDDIKLLINVISYITIAISFGYYVYCLIVNKGYLVFLFLFDFRFMKKSKIIAPTTKGKNNHINQKFLPSIKNKNK